MLMVMLSLFLALLVCPRLLDRDAPGPRQDLERRLTLQAQAKTPKPDPEGVRAMCYDQAVVPDVMPYVCPICGLRSQFPTGTDTATFLEFELPKWRLLAPQIQAVKVTLDESEFCSKCRPGIKNPELGVSVQFPGDREPVKIRTRNLGDYLPLQALLVRQIPSDPEKRGPALAALKKDIQLFIEKRSKPGGGKP
jgi:hypothetical protein